MNIFFRGLAAILPISGTIYLIYWLFTSIESMSNSAISTVLGPKYIIPGVGILATVIVIYLPGLMLGSVPFLRLFEKIQAPFRKIPLVKSIYSAFEDLLQFFDKSGGQEKGRVVQVNIGGAQPIRLVGLLTSSTPPIKSENGEQLVAVYVPVSYQIGGYTIFVSPEQITNLDMSVEDLMKSALTAWMQK